MKTYITVSLDAELVTEARIKKIKFSELFNNTLKTALELDEGEEESLELEDKIINTKARLMSLETEKKKIEEEKEKEKLKREENVTFRREIHVR